MVDSANRPHRVFISYSHKDEAWKERLHTQLKVLERQNQLSIWEDRQIAADCFLIPQLFSARRFSLDLTPYPTILRIEEHTKSLDAFQLAEPSRQPDFQAQ